VIAAACNLKVPRSWYHSIDIECIFNYVKFEYGLSSSVLRNREVLYKELEVKTDESQKFPTFPTPPMTGRILIEPNSRSRPLRLSSFFYLLCQNVTILSTTFLPSLTRPFCFIDYCDVCDCSFPDNATNRRKHNLGQVHINNTRRHYDWFKGKKNRL
jgi:hypothetical protein